MLAMPLNLGDSDVQRTETAQTFRFVVVYRAEAREIAGATPVWRGWVEQVPDPRALDDAMQPCPRLGFQDLAELPALFSEIIARSGAEPEVERQRRTT
jgi:hypothetical protein